MATSRTVTFNSSIMRQHNDSSSEHHERVVDPPEKSNKRASVHIMGTAGSPVTVCHVQYSTCSVCFLSFIGEWSVSYLRSVCCLCMTHVLLSLMWNEAAVTTNLSSSCRFMWTPQRGHTCTALLTVVGCVQVCAVWTASPLMGDVSYCYRAVRAYQNVTVVEKWLKMFQGYEHRQELSVICFGEAEQRWPFAVRYHSAHCPQPIRLLWQLSSATLLPAERPD